VKAQTSRLLEVMKMQALLLLAVVVKMQALPFLAVLMKLQATLFTPVKSTHRVDFISRRP
jgi:hypothetical protein